MVFRNFKDRNFKDRTFKDRTFKDRTFYVSDWSRCIVSRVTMRLGSASPLPGAGSV